MKITRIMLILPTIALMSSCAQSQLKLPAGRDALVSERQTEAPQNFVQYPDDRPSIPDGKPVWEAKNCGSCHGAAGQGGSGPALNSQASLTLKKPVELYKFLAYGKAGSSHTALQNAISAKEIWNLVFYCRSLSIQPLSVAEVKALDPVFGSNCAVCHGTKGDGDGPLARNLEPSPANFQTFRRFYDRSDDILYDHIANGIKWEGMPGFLGREDRIKNFKFDEANISKLVQYVRHFQVTDESTTVPNPAAAAPELSGFERISKQEPERQTKASETR
jgi:mono/diheme cytochrome c family protein